MVDVDTARDLERHPKVGASWEGFMITQIIDRLHLRSDQCFFWRTHTGAELDLLQGMVG